MKVFIGLLCAMIMMSCDLNQPRVFFDPQQNLLYIDSLSNPDFYIQSAVIFSENEFDYAMPPSDTAFQRRQYSFDLDSIQAHHFSIDVYLKRYRGHS